MTFDDKKNKLFPFFLSLSFCVLSRPSSPVVFFFVSRKRVVIKNSSTLSHQYYVFGRNARAPFDGAAAKAKRREEEFIIIFVPVKSSDGDRGGVDVHLRDGDIRRDASSSSAAG